MRAFERVLTVAAGAERFGMTMSRLGLVTVLLWIGGLKAFPYEADGIVPFVANSPVMSFFYSAPPSEYRAHMNKEGERVEANRRWHEANGTYRFAWGLGSVIVLLGLLVAAHAWKPELGFIGSLLVAGMSLTTLSFLVTTPETWVPNLGDAQFGFPYLSARGRLVIKDAIMLGAALVTMTDSARVALAQRAPPIRPG
ncbi:DUF417 family protein [Cystobacter ferrugineus]|uniref:DUF417 domain-containing protein n=1 Tax=Cystobacter ferrugineus TaxID=83449 RepID=A0A1L9BCR1_9BACT|nr:DUF417 family protein [Cystobacter ferrugineus]OJH40047.1 hypothetical protein BON30_13340 [Cystobacter ferrugineus]